MNEAGRNALRAAGLAGVKQIFGELSDNNGGRCGVGVLLAEIRKPIRWEDMNHTFGLAAGPAVCPICEIICSGEMTLMSHANDVHHCDFFKLAELMPVSDAEGHDAAL